MISQVTHISYVCRYYVGTFFISFSFHGKSYGCSGIDVKGAKNRTNSWKDEKYSKKKG